MQQGLQEAENTTIQGNIVTSNGGIGIEISESVNIIAQGNTVSDSTFSGIAAISSVNTMIQDNISSYNGLKYPDPVNDGIAIFSSTKTNVIGNTSVGNTEAGIWIAESTDTFVQDNTTTQNGIWGIIDLDNAGEVTAFFNKSCDNGVANCVNVPLVVAPGDPVYMGANLCCSDPESANAKNAYSPIKFNPPNAPGETEKAPSESFEPAAAF